MISNLVLASASLARANVLRGVGLEPIIDPSGVDEAPLKVLAIEEQWSVEETALALAKAKALDVSNRRPGCVVLGADQMLDVAGTWLDKPQGRAQAFETLARLQGCSHRLISAAVLMQEGDVIWSGVEDARLTMRSLDNEDITTYLDKTGDGILRSVGAYHLEGLGAQLFETVEGDYFTILGLPLTALLAALRKHFPLTAGLI